MERIVAPFESSVNELFSWLTDPSYRTWWGHWVVFFAVGLCYYKIRLSRIKFSWREACRYVFPPTIYFSKSTLQDILLNLIDIGTRFGLAVAVFKFALTPGAVRNQLRIAALKSRFHLPSTPLSSSPLVDLVYSISVFLSFEIGWYFVHWLFHRIPVLWAFHRVHHSAQTLTPITAGRFHIVDTICTYSVIGFVGGFCLLSFIFLGYSPRLEATYGMLFLMPFFLIFGNFRHSHIPISFGRASWIFFSPVMHQLHHSSKAEHQNKTFGYYLSTLDWLFGTLSLPKDGEDFEFGLHDFNAEDPGLMEIYFYFPLRACIKAFKGIRIFSRGKKLNVDSISL